MKTFSITTLGCRVNHYESEQLATLLRARGLVQTDDPARADLRVVHTCTVTTEAASKSRQTVRRNTRLTVLAPPSRYATGTGPEHAACAVTERQLSRESSSTQPTPGPVAGARAVTRPKVIVTGCWATSNRDQAAALPGVDAVLGHHQDVGLELTRLLTQWQAEEKPPTSTSPVCTTSPIPLHSNSRASESGSEEEWMMQKAGTPAARITRANEPHRPKEVNGKLEHDEDPCDAIHEDLPNPRAAHRRLTRGTTTLPQLDSRQSAHQRAFLKVQDGCDAHCTYCIIPQLRPTLWSKPVDDAVAEARALVAAGHHELVLTGIFLGAYGYETALRRRQRRHPIFTQDSGLGTQDSPLLTLIDAVCTRVPDLRRLRLSSLEPGDLTPALLDRLRAHPQVVPHFHLPLQSGSDAILRRMNRQYTRGDFLRMVEHLTQTFDRPAITTDVIVGFPGESDAQFAQTLDVVEKVRFIHTHAFPYSPRPNTAAARWTDKHIPGPVVHQRMARLRDLAREHSFEFRQRFLNETLEVLVESPSPGERDVAPLANHQHGRTERYFPVHFPSASLPPGTPARVRIDRVTPTGTFGTLQESAR
jgi:MiaB/RimO family radical SAM methylthiotransferase